MDELRQAAVIGPNMIGSYGSWAASLSGEGPAAFSWRNPRWKDQDEWRAAARRRFLERLAPPAAGEVPAAEVLGRLEWDGLEIEELSWRLPYGPPARGMILKPAGAEGRLPGLLALHDHAGDKYFGFEKISRSGAACHPLMAAHQERYYGGAAWANEAAKRGYLVLVPDAFAFASRRVLLADVPESLRGGLVDPGRDDEPGIAAYNGWAGGHEAIMAKSLFCAGTTWPGLALADDRAALDLLCARDDVDPSRVGCAGLSGGGLRTVLLGGSDDRVACAVCAGMMTTWRDFMLNKSWTHTWMIYPPLLAAELDFPEILGLRVPLPTLVLNNTHDGLFTPGEMERADSMLRETYGKAGADERYRCSFHPGPHKFDPAMQEEAFGWLDRWLKS